MNEIIKCLMNHRSVRKFQNRPIEREILESILAAGTRAATGGNLQLYSMLVIDDKDRLAALDKALEAPFFARSNCPLAIFALADQRRVRRWLRLHSSRTICNHRPYNFFMAVWDSLIALQNIVVAAESLGLGTCYLGGGIELDVREMFDVPEYVFPAGLVCLGYPEVIPDLSMRLPMDAVIHYNRYRLPSDDDIHGWYHERDRVWETVSESRKKVLAEQGIDGIANALSVQKFSEEIVERRSRGILRNLRQAGFDLHTGEVDGE